MADTDLTVRELHDPREHQSGTAILARVWPVPGGGAPNGSDLLTALSHAGGYVGGAYHGDTMVGVSFGFLARTEHGELALHSHSTAVVPEYESRGIGFRLKQHQWNWAQERGLASVTWTFDPLLRRNAYFNLTKLGARIVGYVPNYYGALSDGVNAGDETDRAIARWSVVETAPAAATHTERVWIPDGVLELRRRDPAAALALRREIRATLGGLIDAGYVATAMSRDGWYTLERP
jgi:predicted GNAT superfamily acetyltransferase